MIIAIVLCLITGAAVGFLNGLLGMGGAFIIVPALNYILTGLGASSQLAQLIAIGSAPPAMFLTCLASFRAHCKLGNVYFPILYKLAAGCVAGSCLGAFVAPMLSVIYLKSLFALLCICMGSIMIVSPNFTKHAESISCIPIAGFLLGILAALTGLAGTLVCLTWLNWRGISWRKAVGASSGFGLITTLVITISYIFSGLGAPNLPFGSLGYIWLPGVFVIMLPGLFTATLGARLLSWKKLPIPAMKKGVGAILILMAIQIIFNLCLKS